MVILASKRGVSGITNHAEGHIIDPRTNIYIPVDLQHPRWVEVLHLQPSNSARSSSLKCLSWHHDSPINPIFLFREGRVSYYLHPSFLRWLISHKCEKNPSFFWKSRIRHCLVMRCWISERLWKQNKMSWAVARGWNVIIIKAEPEALVWDQAKAKAKRRFFFLAATFWKPCNFQGLIWKHCSKQRAGFKVSPVFTAWPKKHRANSGCV